MPRLPEPDSFGLVRQPLTRCPALDSLIVAAYDAYEDDEVVVAMYWFVLVDLRGVRSYASEIMCCVSKWYALGCPTQEELIGGSFRREQYDLGFAAMLWFSQMYPEQAAEIVSCASNRGDRDARMFGFKFLGPFMFRPPDGRAAAFGTGHREALVLAFMTVVVILLVLLLVLGIYAVSLYVSR